MTRPRIPPSPEHTSMSQHASYSLGIDIGGTFTDVVL